MSEIWQSLFNSRRYQVVRAIIFNVINLCDGVNNVVVNSSSMQDSTYNCFLQRDAHFFSAL